MGFSYSEILKEISVAKSTLTLWFKSVELASFQKQKITEKRILGQKRAAAARRSQRIERQKNIYESVKNDIGLMSKREFWLLGIILYWAEGSKEKEWKVGSRVEFTNSDSRMIRLFVKWLKEFGKIKEDDFVFSIFIHENSEN